jgi:hypothetical protein
MHIVDKLGRVAVGDLLRSKQRQVTNPFPAGQALVKLGAQQAVHFAYGRRLQKLHNLSPSVLGGAALIKLTTQHCTTRVAARHAMLHRVIRMSRVLKLYHVVYEHECRSKNLLMTDGDRTSLCEMLAVAEVGARVTTLVQTENGACSLIDLLLFLSPRASHFFLSPFLLLQQITSCLL